MATIQKTHAGTFKAIIRENGRLIKTKTFKTKKLAREWARRIEGDREAMRAFGLPGASIPFNHCADEFLAQWSGKSKISHQVRFWKEHIGATKLSDITTNMVRCILDRYYAGELEGAPHKDSLGRRYVPQKPRPKSEATVNRAKAALSSMLQFAIHKGYIDKNVVRVIPAKTERNKRVRFLSDDERRRLMDACRQSEWERLYLMVLMALTTGARQGELLKLTWNDINWQAQTATAVDTKNGENRLLPLTDPVIAELKNFRGIGGFVFPSPYNPIKAFMTGFRKHWNQALIDAEIADFRFHDLRHSAASMLVMNGATLYEAAQVLGHRSVQTTQRYAHLSIEHKAKVVARIMGGIGK